ncbi:hypothetical protein DKX38_020387 [Salix brachista]|uniref:Uncharacterized protein n=1 Tax=Salix brachista TaxID=2182728 RepID=A0A5N5KA64_9ROSI|nr:hypothetical protein DKX38_020387 [Salix brachista]
MSVWFPLAWPGLELLHLGLTSPLLPSFFPGWFKPLLPRFSANSRSNAPGTELFSCCRMASFWPSGAQVVQIVICVGRSADRASYSSGTGFLGLPCGVSSPAFPGLLGELTWFYFSDFKLVALGCGWLSDFILAFKRDSVCCGSSGPFLVGCEGLLVLHFQLWSMGLCYLVFVDRSLMHVLGVDIDYFQWWLYS